MWNAKTNPSAHFSELREAIWCGYVHFQKDYAVNTPDFWCAACQAAQVYLRDQVLQQWKEKGQLVASGPL